VYSQQSFKRLERLRASSNNIMVRRVITTNDIDQERPRARCVERHWCGIGVVVSRHRRPRTSSSPTISAHSPGRSAGTSRPRTKVPKRIRSPGVPTPHRISTTPCIIIVLAVARHSPRTVIVEAPRRRSLSQSEYVVLVFFVHTHRIPSIFRFSFTHTHSTTEPAS
jgi:hypothetical protein